MKNITAIVVVFVSLLSAGCIMPVRFEGTSMIPNYDEGDRVMIKTSFGKLKRGDVVSHLYPNNEKQQFMKRIIGLPNETVEIRGNIVFIDGKQLDEPYLNPQLNTSTNSSTIKTVGADSYFVMGDNRDNSSDSRVWGTVRKDQIRGVAWFTYAKAQKTK